MKKTIKIIALDKGLIEKEDQQLSMSASEVKKFQDEQIAVRNLKSTIFKGTPKVLVDANTGEAQLVTEIAINKAIDEEEVLSHYAAMETKARESAELIAEHIVPGETTQIFLPENLVFEENRDPLKAPELLDGKLHYGHDDEIKQMIKQEEVLKRKELVLDGQCFDCQNEFPSNFLINSGLSEKQTVELSILGWDEKNGIQAGLTSENLINLTKVKISWLEKILKKKTHLKLIKHLIYADKNSVKVLADVHTKYDPKKNQKQQIPDSITVLEILDDGLNYLENAKKIWE